MSELFQMSFKSDEMLLNAFRRIGIIFIFFESLETLVNISETFLISTVRRNNLDCIRKLDHMFQKISYSSWLTQLKLSVYFKQQVCTS
jgi:hypothetical protein